MYKHTSVTLLIPIALGVSLLNEIKNSITYLSKNIILSIKKNKLTIFIMSFYFV